MIRRLARWTLYCAAGLAVALAALQGWYLYQVLRWNSTDPGMTSFMSARLQALRERNPRARVVQAWAPYSRISIHLKRAVVAAEDAKFIDHEGFDWAGIQHAIDRNRRKGRVVAGGSTITQQVAKNLFLSGQRSLTRKAQEALITGMLEAVMDKRRILEIYLNVAEWGEDLFGAEAAARHYFGVTAARLSQEQGPGAAARR